MSSHSNFKSNKCWSCEYFSGKREYKRGAFLGDSVYTDGPGICSCKRSSNYNKKVNDDSYCSRYQKWGILQSALVAEEQKKESERIAKEQQKEAERLENIRRKQERELENERERLNQERKLLERERLLASMTPEERNNYLEEERKEKEKELADKKRRAFEHAEKERLKEIENNKQKARNYKAISLAVPIGSLGLSLIVFLIVIMQSVAAAFVVLGVMFIPAAVASIITFLIMRKKREAIEKEIEELEEHPVDKIAVETEQKKEADGTSKIVVKAGGEELGTIRVKVKVDEGPTAEELFLKEYDEEYAYLTFLHKYESIKASKNMCEGDYPHWMFLDCGVKEVRKLHIELEDKGFYTKADPIHFVAIYKVGELRDIASKLGIEVRGKKEDIQHQIANSSTTEKLEEVTGQSVDMISEKGKNYLKDNEMKWEYYCNANRDNISYEEYAKTRESKSLDDTKIEEINKEIKDDDQTFGRNAYYDRANIYLNNNEKELALIDLITVLRIDLSGVSAYKAIKDFGDAEFRTRKYSEIIFAPGLLNDIRGLKDAFKFAMLDTVYLIKLPLDATDKMLMGEILSKIFSNEMDQETCKKYQEKLNNIFEAKAKLI